MIMGVNSEGDYMRLSNYSWRSFGLRPSGYVVGVSRQRLDKNGQALFEFIIFLPFYIIMLSIMISIAGSINGSINQQKATRGYFYSRIASNSTIPKKSDLQAWADSGRESAGVFVIGWKDKDVDDEPIAPCYKINTMVTSSDETCDQKVKQEDGAQVTKFIKAKTVYGVCSTTYRSLNLVPPKVAFENLSSGSCTLK